MCICYFFLPRTLSITLPLPRLYLRYAKRLYAAAEHELGVKLNASEAARDRAETESLLLAESSLRSLAVRSRLWNGRAGRKGPTCTTKM